MRIQVESRGLTLSLQTDADRHSEITGKWTTSEVFTLVRLTLEELDRTLNSKKIRESMGLSENLIVTGQKKDK